MRRKDVWEIWNSSEHLIGFLWIISDVLTHKFDVVNASYCSRSIRVLSIRNCAECLKFSDNKASTAR